MKIDQYITYTISNIYSLLFKNFKYRLFLIVFLYICNYIAFAYVLKTFGCLLQTFTEVQNIYFVQYLTQLTILNLTTIILSGIVKFIYARLGPEVMHTLERDLFSYILKHDVEYFQKNSPTKIIHAIGSIRSSVLQILDLYLQILSSLIGQIVNIYMAIKIHWHFGILSLCYFCCAILQFLFFIYSSKDLYRKYNQKIIYMGDDAGDTLKNINNAVKISATKAYEEKRFTNNSKQVMIENIKLENMITYMVISNQALFIIIDIAAYLIGNNLFKHNLLDVACMTQYITMLVSSMESYKSLGTSIPFYFGALQSLTVRIKLIGAPVLENKNFDLVNLDGIREIKINSTFGHKNNPMLFKNLIMNFKKGYSYGLVGASGSGKSTLASMLIGILPKKYSGQFAIINNNGEKFELSEINPDSLQKRIVMMTQSNDIFMNRSILENIRYGNMFVSENDVVHAAQNAQAHSFIIKLKDGYNTIPSESGIKLSGGQMQRLLIARLMVQKNIDFIIFDEGTSALDNNTEYLIKYALKTHKNEANNPGIIIIAHRLTTLEDTDLIYVFSEGKIIEQGHPNVLLQNPDSNYYKLYYRILQ